MANSSVTIATKEWQREKGHAHVVTVEINFVADDTDGSVPATAFSEAVMQKIRGLFLETMIVVPDGVTPPQNLFDITLIGGDTGLDLLGGAGVDIAVAAPSQALPLIGTDVVKRFISETPTFTVAGNNVNSAECYIQLIFTRNE